jgi:hypothetical protein
MTVIPRPADETDKESNVYLLLYPDSSGVLRTATLPSRKDVNAALEKLGPDKVAEIKLFRGKEIEVRTKVSFTF